MSRIIMVPHTGGLINYKAESDRLFNGPIISNAEGLVFEYSGDSDESVWATFDLDAGKTKIELNSITGDGMLNVTEDETEPWLLIAKKGFPVVINANNDGPAGVWSTPINSPSGIVGYATTTKIEGESTMEISVTFDQIGDWEISQALINKGFGDDRVRFNGLNIRVVL